MSNTIVNPGVYETLISQAIEDKLKELPDSKYYIQKEGIDLSLFKSFYIPR